MSFSGWKYLYRKSILYHTFEVMMHAKDKDLKKIIVQLESSWKSVLYHWSDAFDDWKKLKHIMRMSFSSWKYLYWKSSLYSLVYSYCWKSSLVYSLHSKWWCSLQIKIWYCLKERVSHCPVGIILNVCSIPLKWWCQVVWWLKESLMGTSFSGWKYLYWKSILYHTYEVMMLAKDKDLKKIIVRLESSWKSVLYTIEVMCLMIERN